jgi:hypothetical protein
MPSKTIMTCGRCGHEIKGDAAPKLYAHIETDGKPRAIVSVEDACQDCVKVFLGMLRRYAKAYPGGQRRKPQRRQPVQQLAPIPVEENAEGSPE